MLLETVPNFSEGRDQELIQALAAAAAAGGHLLDVSSDPLHNRAVVTVAATAVEPLLDGLVEAVREAAERIDLRVHQGAHPRLGAADVLPLVPLDGTPMEACAEAAWRLGERIWADARVPVYFYGAAARRPEARTLGRIRRGGLPPDLGDGTHPTAGAVSVGARPPLVAYNLDVSGAPPAAATRLAAAIRESSGGMSGVQALAFDLGHRRVQLSMNLVRLETVTPGGVLARARELAEGLGIQVAGEEIVGLCPASAADTPAAAGRVLEARLAAAGAREGARRCRDSGLREPALLAPRLEERAEGLAALDPAADGILRGAEEAAALPRVLERVGVLDEDLAEIFGGAARRLRAAVTRLAAERYAERVAALDRWLEEISRPG